MQDNKSPTEESGHVPEESTTQLTLAAAVALADESESDGQEVSHDG